MAWWGYDRSETVFKPADELVQKLVDITSKGGNFILNVGPLPDGTIRAEEAQRLEAIGQWVDRHGDAIFGTTASPFRLLPFFGRVTVKGDTLYIHVFDWPAARQLVLPGLKTAVRTAKLQGQTAPLATERRGGNLVITLPQQAPDAMANVIVVELAAAPQVEPLRIAAAPDGTIHLPALYAEIEAQHGQRAKPMSKAGCLHRQLVQPGRRRRVALRPAAGRLLPRANRRPAGREGSPGASGPGGGGRGDRPREDRRPRRGTSVAAEAFGGPGRALRETARREPQRTADLDLYGVELSPVK